MMPYVQINLAGPACCYTVAQSAPTLAEAAAKALVAANHFLSLDEFLRLLTTIDEAFCTATRLQIPYIETVFQCSLMTSEKVGKG